MRKEQAIMSIAQMLAQMDQGRSLGLANQAASMNPAQAQAYQATRNGGRPMPKFPALNPNLAPVQAIQPMPQATQMMIGGVNRSGGRPMPKFPALNPNLAPVQAIQPMPQATQMMIGGVNRSGGRHGVRPMPPQVRAYSNPRFK